MSSLVKRRLRALATLEYFSWLCILILSILPAWWLLGCSGEPFTTADLQTGGETSVVATGGSSSTGGSVATGGQVTTGGDTSTGGSSQVATTTIDPDVCPCPNNAQCQPKGSACNAPETTLGQVNDKLTCIRSLTRCTSESPVYCFQCST